VGMLGKGGGSMSPSTVDKTVNHAFVRSINRARDVSRKMLEKPGERRKTNVMQKAMPKSSAVVSLALVFVVPVAFLVCTGMHGPSKHLQALQISM